jgi:hypothetical protein
MKWLEAVNYVPCEVAARILMMTHAGVGEILYQGVGGVKRVIVFHDGIFKWRSGNVSCRHELAQSDTPYTKRLAQHSPLLIQALAAYTSRDITRDSKKDNDVLNPSERCWIEAAKSEEPFALVQLHAKTFELASKSWEDEIVFLCVPILELES